MTGIMLTRYRMYACLAGKFSDNFIYLVYVSTFEMKSLVNCSFVSMSNKHLNITLRACTSL